MSFYTDVVKASPKFLSTDRVSDLALLEPVTRAAVQQICAAARDQGITLMVFETYRSQERQQLLFEQKATKLRVVGVHHFGLACDLVKDVAGQPSWKGDFGFLKGLAEDNGLIWGGDWGNGDVVHSFVDADHVQRINVGDQSKLFNLSWYPDAAYRPMLG
jgi:D-alanyl-D-alanine carboxypeptidase